MSPRALDTHGAEHNLRRNRGRRVAVVGSGNWGTTFAKVLADAGCDVTIWARRAEVAAEIQTAKRNSQYLPGVNLPKTLQATTELDEALRGAQLVFLAVPSQQLRDTLHMLEPDLSRGSVLVSLVMASPERRSNDAEKRNGGARLSATELIADLKQEFGGKLVQVGGDATTGRGQVVLSFRGANGGGHG